MAEEHYLLGSVRFRLRWWSPIKWDVTGWTGPESFFLHVAEGGPTSASNRYVRTLDAFDIIRASVPIQLPAPPSKFFFEPHNEAVTYTTAAGTTDVLIHAYAEADVARRNIALHRQDAFILYWSADFESLMISPHSLVLQACSGSWDVGLSVWRSRLTSLYKSIGVKMTLIVPHSG